MHGSFLGISAIHCSKDARPSCVRPTWRPCSFLRANPSQRDPKALKPRNVDILGSSIALLFGWCKRSKIGWLQHVHVSETSSKETRWLFLGGWAGVICIWSRLLRNGACLLLITAFYEPRSREKPDSTLAFQSFLGLKKQCILHDFIHFQGANWKHIKWFFANGICTLTQALLTSSSTAHMHEQMNSFKRHPGNGNTICLFETPYVFLCFYWWFAETRIVHSLSINDLKSSNWKRF